jgi:predicted transcriptional regulator
VRIKKAQAHAHAQQEKGSSFAFKKKLVTEGNAALKTSPLPYPEPTYYLPPGEWGYFSIVSLSPGQKIWQGGNPQRSYQLSQLLDVLPEAIARGRREGKNVYISQSVFNRGCRQRQYFLSNGVLFVDLDIYYSELLQGQPREVVLAKVYEVCDAFQLPYPSVVLFSGRGYYLKWFIDRIPRQTMILWEHIESYLVEGFQVLGGDRQAKDPSRILRLENTYNQKSDLMAEVIAVNWEGSEPQRFNLDEFKHLLPHTTEEVAAWKEARDAKTREFAKNRRFNTREKNDRLAVQQALQDLTKAGQLETVTAESLRYYVKETGQRRVPLARCAELLLRWKHNLKKQGKGAVVNGKSPFRIKQLNWTRFTDLVDLITHKYGPEGVADGLRDHFYMYACNFYALSNLKQDKNFYNEFNAIATNVVPHWPIARRQNAASNIYHRLVAAKRGEVRMYKGREYTPLLTPKNSTLINLLGITREDQQAKDEEGHYILKTIIDKEEKYRRLIESRREKGVKARVEYESAESKAASRENKRQYDVRFKAQERRAEGRLEREEYESEESKAASRVRDLRRREEQRRAEGRLEREQYDQARAQDKAQKVVEARKLRDQGMSQREIAAKMGLSQSQVHKLLK